MKVDGSGGSLLDLVLCAVGCMLFFFILQLATPRAPAQDDKPLVVCARGGVTGTTRFTKLLYRWRLTGPDGRTVQPGEPTGAACYPVNLVTRPDQALMISIPEPTPGRWVLSVKVESEMEDLPPVVQTGASVADEPQDPATAVYFRYLKDSRDPVTLQNNADFTRFQETSSREIDPVRIAAGKIGSHNDRRSVELEWYVRYRVLAMHATTAGRLLSDAKRPEEEREQLRKILGAIEDKLTELLASLKLEADKASEGDDGHWGFQRLYLGLLAEEENRLEYLTGFQKKTPGKAVPRPHNQRLDREVAELPTVRNFVGQDYRTNTGFMLVRADWGRWRSVAEYQVKATSPRQERLSEALGVGQSDPLLRFICRELSVVTRREARLTTDVGLSWGDQRWPAPVEQVSRPGGLRLGMLSVPPRDATRFLPLVEIQLEPGRGTPEVELSGYLSARP